jgi:hypothetical protein
MDFALLVFRNSRISANVDPNALALQTHRNRYNAVTSKRR